MMSSLYDFVLHYRKRALLALTTLSLTIQAFLLSSTARDKLYHQPAVSVSITMAFELTKLLISVVLAATTATRGANMAALRRFSIDASLPYALPAIIYLINDNLLFIIYGAIADPAVVQVLLSLRILTTTLAFRGMLGRAGDTRRLNRIQTSAMLLLTLGTAASQITTCGEALRLDVPVKGFVVVLLYCCLSAFASVLVEFLFKRNAAESFYVQNVQMYAYGVLFNFVVLYVLYSHELRSIGILALLGDNYRTVLLVLNNAVCGLAIAALVTYASTIEKVYAHSISMIVTLAASSLVFGQAPTAQLVFGAATVTIAIFLYYVGGTKEASDMDVAKRDT